MPIHDRIRVWLAMPREAALRGNPLRESRDGARAANRGFDVGKPRKVLVESIGERRGLHVVGGLVAPGCAGVQDLGWDAGAGDRILEAEDGVDRVADLEY